MTKSDPKQAVSEIEPTTKAARLRDVMPEIEKKLAVGVQLRAIHQALTGAGLDLTLQTLKTYLYRYRKELRARTTGQQTTFAASAADVVPGPSQVGEAVLHEAKAPEMQEPPKPQKTTQETSQRTTALREPISMQELDRLMKPDPVQQAEKLARYERLAKQQRRSRK
ncbi:hypothetical protein AWB81_07134 [Caballeronia arationis]|uniref:hypothetical protein n=1 Tax=Caballeronia arationis TaxID=1777142 RepID=UPI00074C04E5|nr:hypothetical protein [Caballeronia arationis]SAL05372.1 hypothetical protein AWB81_07134 [Caballeronia arationis]